MRAKPLTIALMMALFMPALAGTALATVYQDPTAWKVMMNRLCGDLHEYRFLQIKTMGPGFETKYVNATYDPATGVETEHAEGGTFNGKFLSHMCHADPWREPTNVSRCSYLDGSVQAYSNSSLTIVPFLGVKPTVPQPSQIGPPNILLPDPVSYPVGPIKVSIVGPSPWTSPYCAGLDIGFTDPKGVPQPVVTQTGLTKKSSPWGTSFDWKPTATRWGAGPALGQWKVTARVAVYDGAGGFVRGPAVSRVFYVGTPAVDKSMIQVVWPAGGGASVSPVNGGRVRVRIKKPLYDVLPQKRVRLVWQAPWALAANAVPNEIVYRMLVSPSTLWHEAASTPANFAGLPPGSWHLTACVTLADGSDLCSADVAFTNPKP
jgi:hypothetical protein